MNPSYSPILAVQSISKSFGGVLALHNVSLELHPGQVHGLIGENGAGKSTLMRILSGLERPTTGRVLFQGQPVHLASPHDAQKLGIVMIHQELNLIDELSVADNLFLGREQTSFGLIRSQSQRQQALDLLRSVGTDVDPDTKLRHLSIAQKQMVEIAKALSQNARVLIMDEPSAVLTSRETAVLFRLIHDLKSRGVAIVYISHILPEILSVADQITVLRDGQLVTQLTPAQAGPPTDEHARQAKLASLMVGRPMADHFPKRLDTRGQTALEVHNLSVPGLVDNACFSLKRGEILGFAGLIGAGRTELAEALVGLRQRSSGQVLLDGEPIHIHNVRDAVKLGIAYLSEDRRGTGLVLPMSIVENTTLVSLRRYCRPFLSSDAEDHATSNHVNALSIKIGSLHDPVSTLSGGNQQKVALAKWLEISPRVLILDEPTRGVDIGAKEEIYRLIQSLTAKGLACILISSEMAEVIGLSHRIAVMRAGKIEAFLDAESATQEAVMHAAAGVASRDRNTD